MVIAYKFLETNLYQTYLCYFGIEVSKKVKESIIGFANVKASLRQEPNLGKVIFCFLAKYFC